jgi:hypothetical protein
MQNYNTVEKQYDDTRTIFQNYKVTLNDGLHFYVPLDEANTDYQAILTWIADGGTVIDNGGGE